MYLDDFILNCISKYFENVESVMIIGSHANKNSTDKLTDIDIILIRNDFAYSKGYLAVNIDGINIDFTIIPAINFECFLLSEFSSGNTGIIYCLVNGRILKDQSGQLLLYKNFAIYLFDNKDFISLLNLNNFIFKISLLSKLSVDYKGREVGSMETIMIFNQIIEVVTELELIYNIGWRCAGKIKARILSIVRPDFVQRIVELVASSHTVEGKRKIEKDLLDDQIVKFSKIIDNYKIDSFAPVFMKKDRFALEVCSDNILEEIIKYCNFYSKKGKCLYYITKLCYSKGISSAANTLVIKLKEEMSNEFLNYINNKRLEDPTHLKLTAVPLVDLFNGGEEILNESEIFYSCLTHLFYSDANLCKENIGLLVLIDFGFCLEENYSNAVQFYTYLFDAWFNYAFYSESIFYSEFKLARNHTLKKFDNLFETEKKIITILYNSVFKKDVVDAVFKGQVKLSKSVNNLFNFSINCKTLSIPRFEIEKCKLYDEDNNSSTWYILRKQLETSFIILGIEKPNWAYFAYIVKKIMAETTY